MMTSRSRALILALLLTAATVTICMVGCGDDDPTSPSRLPGLADGDSVTATLYVQTIVRAYDDELYLEWRDIGAGLSGASFDEDAYEFAGSRTDSLNIYSRRWNEVRLVLDPATGDIDSLFCHSGYSTRGAGSNRSFTALDVPLTSYTSEDGALEAVWRLEGLTSCTVIDTVTGSWGPGGGRIESWTCAGDETPYLEVRVTN